ncbi:hypothetical protein [Nocardiopsis alba]
MREARSELWLLTVSNMVSEHTFYEAAAGRDSRFTGLIHQCLVPGVMEALKPGKDDRHASTEEVPR